MSKPALSQTLPTELSGRVLVVGLGVTGISCVRLLRSLGVNVAVADTRDCPPGLAEIRTQYPELPLFMGAQGPQGLRSADLLLVSPGLPLSDPLLAGAVSRGVPVWGDIELFARLVSAPVVAITGSNGKSTVTTLLGKMLVRAGMPARVGGNLGTAALDLIDADARFYVLELSSFQLETTSSLDAAVAAVLNVSADHLDRYTDIDDYAAAKARVYRGHGVQVINRDDARVSAMALAGRPQTGFSLGRPRGEDFGIASRAGVEWMVREGEWLMRSDELALRGRHNLANALAALALGDALRLPCAAMIEALRTFQGLPHRCQLVREFNGIRFFDDSKGTNVAASVAAIQGLPGTLVLIAGGLAKGQDLLPLRAALAGRARAAVLIGADARQMATALGDCCEVHHAVDMAQAVTVATRLAHSGDSVLLSPACSSLDMFRDFAERGRVFTTLVGRLR